jgi:hypothetical protein
MSVIARKIVRHPEFISGSVIIALVIKYFEMLKQVQYDV